MNRVKSTHNSLSLTCAVTTHAHTIKCTELFKTCGNNQFPDKKTNPLIEAKCSENSPAVKKRQIKISLISFPNTKNLRVWLLWWKKNQKPCFGSAVWSSSFKKKHRWKVYLMLYPTLRISKIACFDGNFSELILLHVE